MTGMTRTVEYKRVVVTGVGVVSPIGIGKAPFLETLLAGRSGVRVIERFDTTEYPVKIAAEVTGFRPSATSSTRRWPSGWTATPSTGRPRPSWPWRTPATPSRKIPTPSERSSVPAWAVSTPSSSRPGSCSSKGPTRVSPFFIPMMIPNMASASSSILLGLKGPVNATCTACAAGTNALGDAFSIIRRGDATAMFAGGAEAAVNQVGMSAFAALRALSTRNDEPERASRPFDAERDGFVMGEGGGVLVLEELEHALKRGAHIYAEIVGYGMTGDASHLTEPDETGEPAGPGHDQGSARRGHRARPRSTTSTPTAPRPPSGDAMETKAIKLALGDHARQGHGQLQQEHLRPLPGRGGRSRGRGHRSFHGSW